jgi:hypothetical protein
VKASVVMPTSRGEEEKPVWIPQGVKDAIDSQGQQIKSQAQKNKELEEKVLRQNELNLELEIKHS